MNIEVLSKEEWNSHPAVEVVCQGNKNEAPVYHLKAGWYYGPLGLPILKEGSICLDAFKWVDIEEYNRFVGILKNIELPHPDRTKIIEDCFIFYGNRTYYHFIVDFLGSVQNVVNNFKSRSGLASSSRDVAKKLWPTGVPLINLEENAKLLFNAENTPEKEYISGAEDHTGIIYPGITHTKYNGSYWPEKIENTQDPSLINWLESVVKLVPVSSRKDSFDPRAREIWIDL